MGQQTLLYDYQRDKDVKVGEAIIVFEDGKTRRVRESSLYAKEEPVVREPIIQRAGAIRSRASGEVQHRKATTRHFAPRKRTPVYTS